jgi:hypothetical protein
MPYPYRPLQDGEIRLLTIEALGDGDAIAPVRCTLTHVRIDPKPTVHAGNGFRGDDLLWPDGSGACDDTALFRKSQRRQEAAAQQSSPRAAAASDIAAEADLPWRYTWGDFIALSYVWGVSEPRRHIELDGADFFVTPNLHEALVQLRQSQRVRQGFKVWIDAICIHQDDLAERNAQVARMRDIYQAAWQVVVWLGPAADNSDLAMAAMEWLAAQAKEDDPLAGFHQPVSTPRAWLGLQSTYRSTFKSEVYRALSALFRRPYWRRMWIMQEIAMGSRSSPVLCGQLCLTWSEIYDAAAVIARDEDRFGRDIVRLPRAVPPFPHQPFEFARDRLIDERDWAAERMWRVLISLMEVQGRQRLTARATSGDITAQNDDLMDVLVLGRDANLTQERDRVYGILGIRAIADRVKITPNYALRLEDVYTDFSSRLLQTGHLDLLRFISREGGYLRTLTRMGTTAPPERVHSTSLANRLLPFAKWTSAQRGLAVGAFCKHAMPSWVVCWTCKPLPTARLKGAYHSDRLSRQAGRSEDAQSTAGLQAMPKLSLDGQSLVVRGAIIDGIESLGTFHEWEDGDAFPCQSEPPHQNQHSSYGDLAATRSAFCHTLVADTTVLGVNSELPEPYMCLLNPDIWRTILEGVDDNGFGLHRVMKRNRLLRLSGYTLEALIYGASGLPSWLKRYGNPYAPGKQEQEIISWATNVMAWRRLMGTVNGRMGLAPAAARLGDSIAVLIGCSTPILLRKLGSGWAVVGECFVQGIMYGEVFESGSLELVDITLK